MGTDITFISTSDSHYRHDANSQQNQWNRETIRQMNAIAGTRWPENLGGDAVPAGADGSGVVGARGVEMVK